MNRRSSYKISFFDRHGPDAALYLQAARFGFVVFGVSLIMCYVLGAQKLGLDGFSLIAFTLGGAATLSGLSMFVGLKLGSFAGTGASHVYMGGSTTPYQDQFSQEQALVMQRDYAGALHLYEQKIQAQPGDSRVRLAAADLYGTLGDNPKRAAELYREVQRIPQVPTGQDVYASNKLADLYLGKLREPKRALVEFSRLIQRYPNSTASKNARLALDNLKPDMMKESEGESDQPPA